LPLVLDCFVASLLAMTRGHGASRLCPPYKSRALAQPLVLAEALVEGIAGAAHGADRVGGAAAVERAAQAADVDVDRALVDIDVAPPHAVEQLLAREHPARALHEELEQAELGRATPSGAPVVAQPWCRAQVRGRHRHAHALRKPPQASDSDRFRSVYETLLGGRTSCPLFHNYKETNMLYDRCEASHAMQTPSCRPSGVSLDNGLIGSRERAAM
jgi:hypothetical protein